MTLCPRNCGRLSRRVRVARPVVGIPKLATLCRECWIAEACGPDRRGQYRAANRSHVMQHEHGIRRLERAARIEARYQAALGVIQARRRVA